MADHHTQTYTSQEDVENENLGRGSGDPDVNQDPNEAAHHAAKLANLVNDLGAAKAAGKQAYEAYRAIKAEEAALQEQLETALYVLNLRSAKASNYTASVAEKPTVVIYDEQATVTWLKEAPGVEYDQYVGLKKAEFNTLANSLLKHEDVIIPGTNVEVRKSLRITASKQKTGVSYGNIHDNKD
jgi:hypothetical protein